ncbi:MAG: NAD(P)H-dependent oxidoreductase [Desulfobacterales bacterium]|nr:NAD(P)H-dependent oxidoreductase [Desulfobacterales bacterium]
MFVLGLQGSPRKKGNTAYLLEAFLQEAKKYGARTHTLDICRKNIVPCKELVVCEKKGFCPIEDDMATEIYPLLRRADVVVAASPIFFYNVTAQLKALIDRSQALWARKYRLKLKDPGSPMRQGFLLAVGATRGKQLFDGVHLTAKYFFDALAAGYHGSLTYPGIEHTGDMARHPRAVEDIQNAVRDLMAPFTGRPRVLFLGRKGHCRTQMAAAFARFHGSDVIDVRCAGVSPVESMNNRCDTAMAEKGMDLKFCRPYSVAEALPEGTPDLVVTLDPAATAMEMADSPCKTWELPDTTGDDFDALRAVRDDIEQRVLNLIAEYR